MFCGRFFYNAVNYSNLMTKTILFKNCGRYLYLGVQINNKNKNDNDKTALAVQGTFERITNKNKNTYLELIEIFVNRDVHRRGHVEFIQAALKNMKDFGVNKDLEVYKALVDVLPKGKLIPRNMIQAEFMHYPKQQLCIIDLLEQMEDNAVMPDEEMEDMLLNIFGKRGYPLRKFWRMMYWMPKFKNLSPWPVPMPVPNDIYELAKLAIERISSVDIQTEITVYQTSDIADSIDDTWIISSQSHIQKQLLATHNPEKPVYVEGAFRVWIKDKPVNYFLLRADPKPKDDEIEDADDVSNIKASKLNLNFAKHKVALIHEVHEQDDGVILAICATGTSSKDSLLSWIRHLEKDRNPILSTLHVVFTLRSSQKEIVCVNEDDSQSHVIEDK